MSTVDTVIKTAKAQIGYREGYADGHWNNQEKFAPQVPGLEWAQGQAWCAVFVSWVAQKAGVPDLYPRTASCDVAGAWFKSRKRWSEYPAIGAQVFYGAPTNLDHTGIVVDYDADTITTVEGNTNADGSREGNGVYLKTRPRRASSVVGYGYPLFPEGIKSADPAYAKPAPTPAPAPAPTPAPAVPDPVPTLRRKVSVLTRQNKALRGRIQRAINVLRGK